MKPRPKRLDPNTVVLLKHVGIGVLVISVVALLLTGIWYGTRVQSLTITDVEASGGETIEHGEVEQSVQAVLDGKYLGFVPRRFAWFYPRQEVLDEVLKTERLYNVMIVREGLTKLHISYDEYVPHALWCAFETESCIFLDVNGYAFALAPKLSGGTFLRFITSGREAVIGEEVAEKKLYEYIQEIVQSLTERGWYVSYVEIDQVGDVFLKVVGGGELKVSVDETSEKTVENLFVVLSSEEFQHIKPGNFKYIDLRFGDKVFVNEELATSESAVTSSTTATTSEEVSQ